MVKPKSSLRGTKKSGAKKANRSADDVDSSLLQKIISLNVKAKTMSAKELSEQRIKFPRVTAEQWKRDKLHNLTVNQHVKKRKTTKSLYEEVQTISGEMSSDPNVRARQCPICSMILPAPAKLNRHMRSHTTQAEVTCNLCGTNIKYSYNLRNHLKLCQEKQRALNLVDFEIVKKHYPKYMEDSKKASEDLSRPMPALPAPFKMDKYGFITGIDYNLQLEMKDLIPNYNKDKLDLKIPTDDENEDDYEDDDEIMEERADDVPEVSPVAEIEE